VRELRSIFLATALVVVLAVAGTAANLWLLRLTQDTSDPVGRLSPRAVFPAPTQPRQAPVPVLTPAPGEHHHGADD
jgi:anti-sigma factor RsiW